MHDPAVHHYWKTLSDYGVITTIYEELVPIFSTREGLEEEILENGA
jgi:hypothetical protein